MTGTAPVLLTGDNQRAAGRLAAQAGIARRARRACSRRTRSRAVRELEADGQPGPAGRRRRQRRARPGRRAHRRRDGPRRLRPRPGHRRRRHHARRPGRPSPPSSRCPAAPAAWSPPTWSSPPSSSPPWSPGTWPATCRCRSASLGHEGSTVIVGLNGLRLLRAAAWRKALNGGRYGEPAREDQRQRRDSGQRRGRTVTMCHGCCCGQAEKNPRTDHAAQLARLREALPLGARLRTVGLPGRVRTLQCRRHRPDRHRHRPATSGVGVKSLTNGIIDTTTAHGKLVFGMFALMAEYEAALIRERTQAGLQAAPGPRAQGSQETQDDARADRQGPADV